MRHTTSVRSHTDRPTRSESVRLRTRPPTSARKISSDASSVGTSSTGTEYNLPSGANSKVVGTPDRAVVVAQGGKRNGYYPLHGGLGDGVFLRRHTGRGRSVHRKHGPAVSAHGGTRSVPQRVRHGGRRKAGKLRSSPAHNQAAAWRSTRAEEYPANDKAPRRGEFGSAAQSR
jgi:hypothetical protein